MQTGEKKNSLTIDNLILMNAIREKQRQDHKNTYCLQMQKNVLSNSG